jgi:hypothetical protein
VVKSTGDNFPDGGGDKVVIRLGYSGYQGKHLTSIVLIRWEERFHNEVKVLPCCLSGNLSKPWIKCMQMLSLAQADASPKLRLHTKDPASRKNHNKSCINESKPLNLKRKLAKIHHSNHFASWSEA